jgi:hypothetical protein
MFDGKSWTAQQEGALGGTGERPTLTA